MPTKLAELNSLAIMTLEKFIEFLNMWENEQLRRYPEEPVHDYEVMEFFKFDETKLLKDVVLPVGYSGHAERMIIMTAGTGDEGGPSLLVAKWRRWDPQPGRPKKGEWELQWMVQEFDTIGRMIWDYHGGWQNAPELVRPAGS